MEMLTYFEIIFYRIFLPFIFLRWLINPFFSSWENLKVKIVCSIAVVVVAVNNYLFCTNERVYRRNAVMFTINSVPIDEYLREGLQILITAFWTFLCTRWTIHSLYLSKPSYFGFHLTRYSIIFAMMSMGILGLLYGSTATRLLSSFTPAICCIWFVAGQYIIRRFWSVAISVIVPSLYFFYVDSVAIQNQIWNAKEVNSDERSYLQLLGYYIIVNGMIVFASAALDKSKAVLDTFYPRHQLDLRSHCEFPNGLIANARRLCKGLLSDEINLPASVFEDFQYCMRFVNRLSSSTHVQLWTKVLTSGSAQDFVISYSFCRIADDIIDSSQSKQDKKNFLSVYGRFLDEIYKNHHSDKELIAIVNSNEVIDYQKSYSKSNINWRYYESKLTAEQIHIFRSFSRMAFYLPRKPLDDLIKGFRFDIKGDLLKDENQLCNYAKCVGSGPFTIMLFLLWNKGGDWPSQCNALSSDLVDGEHVFGKILQVIDISRDMVSDSEERRCVTPTDYFRNEEYKSLAAGEHFKVENDVFMQCFEKLMMLNDQLIEELPSSISLLAKEARFLFLGALEIWRDEALIVKHNGIYKFRRLSMFTRLLITLKWAYFPGDILKLKFNKDLQ